MRLYHQIGRCTRCHEMTELGDPCCPTGKVQYQGHEWTREEVIARDVREDYCCDCQDCADAENGPCEFDCEEGEGECSKCRESRLDLEEDHKTQEFEWKKSTGQI